MRIYQKCLPGLVNAKQSLEDAFNDVLFKKIHKKRHTQTIARTTSNSRFHLCSFYTQLPWLTQHRRCFFQVRLFTGDSTAVPMAIEHDGAAATSDESETEEAGRGAVEW